jgi:DNA-binding CsgD family transcriptional regulator
VVRPSLVERERELAVIAEGIDHIRGGCGRVLVIEAVAGQGKTALVEAAARLAEDTAGVRVLRVRARHLEAAAPYQVLRRLLAPVVKTRGGPHGLTAAAAFAAPLFTPDSLLVPGVDYGCQSLLTAESASDPLLIAVDDAHWADADSLRVLAELADDLRDDPVLLIVAARPGENPAAQGLLARLATAEVATLLNPAPLTEAGVHKVLTTAFGSPPDPALTRICAQASGGNVFYLREIIRPLLAAGRAPDAVTADEVELGGPATLARTVRGRLSQLGPDGVRLARAAATLGDDSALEHVAAVAGLPPARAGAEATRLVAAAILNRAEPIAFPHPLIRAAVEHDAPPGAIGALHVLAADVLRRYGASSRRIVQHLAAAPPAASEPTCRQLLAEAQADLAAGSTTVAHRLLSRALAEPPPVALRPAVLLALAQAERAEGEPAAAREHLTEVVESGDRPVSVAALWELLELLIEMHDLKAVAREHRRALAAQPYGDTQEEVRLRALLLAHAGTGLLTDPPGALVEGDLDQLPARTGDERVLLVCAAVHRRGMAGGQEKVFVEHLRRAVRDLPEAPALGHRDVIAALEGAAYLAATEAMDEADDVLTRILPAVARLRGIAPDLQAEWNNRTILNLVRRGRFEEALALLDGAESFARRHALTLHLQMVSYARGMVALYRGDYAEAGALLLRAPLGHGTMAALGELLSGRPDAALRLLAQAAYEVSPEAPAREAEILFEPHLIASHAHNALHHEADARAEANRELAIRRRHGPAFRLALALHRRARFAPPREAVTLLAEAVQVCAETPRLPVQARVLAGHGAALRRAGHLTEARVQLAAALDLTDRLGMTRLRERVVVDLHAAGGRIRRTRTTGAEALTDSQRAVAVRAAQGLTNRRIAGEMYVSVKTVETHLAAAYRKLGVASRRELPAVLPA